MFKKAGVHLYPSPKAKENFNNTVQSNVHQILPIYTACFEKTQRRPNVKTERGIKNI